MTIIEQVSKGVKMSLEARIEKLEENLKNQTIQTVSKLESLQFWCGTKQKEDCCFTHTIGLPKHPVTFEPTKFMPYQESLFQILEHTKHNKFHFNKSRQIGFTEIILRILQFRCFNKYKAGKVMIIAGTREKTAAKIMTRFKQLFRNIPDEIENTKDRLKLILKNGTEIEALPSNSDAIRGDTKIRAIFVDEAAHFKLLDDSVVLDAIEPIAFTNQADLFLVSTPNGPKGFFYKLSIQENDYFKMQFDYTKALNFIYTEEQMVKELKRIDIDIEQEYMTQFTTPLGSILPRIPEDSISERSAITL